MNEVMFVTGGELLQFLPISSKKRVGMSICFFGHLKEEKYKWGSGWFSLIKSPDPEKSRIGATSNCKM